MIFWWNSIIKISQRSNSNKSINEKNFIDFNGRVIHPSVDSGTLVSCWHRERGAFIWSRIRGERTGAILPWWLRYFWHGWPLWKCRIDYGKNFGSLSTCMVKSNRLYEVVPLCQGKLFQHERFVSLIVFWFEIALHNVDLGILFQRQGSSNHEMSFLFV